MRVARILAWIATVIIAAGVGLLAGWAAFVPPAPDQQPAPDPEYTVTEETVGRSFTISASGTWQSTDLAAGASEGTITSIEFSEGELVDNGTVLFSVDLRPVVVAEGSTPSFRDLRQGSSGPDVRQLQQMLVALGYLRLEPDSRFGPLTDQAVRAWQRGTGFDVDGVVRAGDVMYATALPARVQLADEVVIGARITPGTVTAAVMSDEPEFELELTDATMTPTSGMAVDVHGPGAQPWPATITDLVAEDGQSTPSSAVLTSTDDGPICGHECDLVPAGGTTYPAEVELVPSRTGPVVPLSAVGTDAGGDEFVRALDGARIPVDLLIADGSRAVVDGIEPGDRIRLFAEPQSQAAGDE